MRLKQAIYFKVLAVALAAFPLSAEVAQSPSFKLLLNHVGGAGGAATSTGFRTLSVLGQPLAGPLNISASFGLRAGFVQHLVTNNIITVFIDPSQSYNFCLFPAYGKVCFDIPVGAYVAPTTFTATVPISYPPALSNISSFNGTNIGVQSSNNQNFVLQKFMTVTFTYLDPFVAGVDETRLTGAAFSADRRWFPQDTAKNASTNVAAVQTKLSGFLRLLDMLPSDSIANAFIYPNPAGPGQQQVNVTNLPPNTSLMIFTISGELVRTLDTDNLGRAIWDLKNGNGAKVQSDVYFLLIRRGSQKKTYKIAVEH